MITQNTSLRASLAIALKAKHGVFGGKWGGGFNAELEISWVGVKNLEERRTHFSALVRMLDHCHLGFDAPEFGITTPESLLTFCGRYLRDHGVEPVRVRLARGEDVIYEQRGVSEG